MKRLPVVRHVRYLIAMYGFKRWWKKVGQHFWIEPNPNDLQYLKEIRDGVR